MDHRTIEATVSRMLFAIDRLRWDDLEDHFSDRVQIDYTSLFGGDVETLSKEELLSRWRGLLPGFDATQHMTGPIVVTAAEANEAVAETHVRGYHYLNDESWMVAGHYTMRLEHDGTKWRIASIRLDVYRQEGNRELPALALERARTNPRS